MTAECTAPAIVARAWWPYRLIARTAASVAFSERLLSIEGVPRRGRVELPFDALDQVIEKPSWFWTRLTFRGLDGLEYSIGGLPKEAAASLAAPLRDEAHALAERHGGQLVERQRQLERSLAGERYLRYGDGERLREEMERTLSPVTSTIVRAQLDEAALRAFGHLHSVAAADDFARVREDANNRYITTAVADVGDAMKTSLDMTPTDEQAKAIATDEDTTLVLAGAGTGKTGVITGKVAHLIHNEGARPDEILVLAYNRDAAKEIRKRLGRDLAGAAVSTFHAFGRGIIGQVSTAPTISRLAEDQRVRNQAFDKILNGLLISPADAKEIAEFAVYHGQPYRSPFEFNNLSDYMNHVRGIEKRTLNGELVKSHEELKIANFLALKGVSYRYEARYQVDTATSRHRQYQPDFYLPEHDIYIEHFALDADGQAPAWFEGYLEGVRWKRGIHEQYGTRLIETFSWQNQDNTLLPELERQLREQGVRFEPTPIERFIDNLRKIIESWLARLLATFLSLVKTAGLTMEELRKRAKVLPHALRNTAFLNLFERVWNRYEKILEKEGAIDFDDLINRAVDAIRGGRWASPFRYVLVDEFQDISAGRMALIEALNAPDVRYFLVGDDWQSINRFAGSDVNLMTSCGDHLGFVQRRELTRTFRYGEPIIRPSSAFIQRNPEQTRRTLRGKTAGADDGVTIVATDEQPAGVADALADVVRRVAPSQEASVLLLGRYQKSLLEEEYRSPRPNVHVECSTIHKAKGREADYVIVLDLMDSFYGLPAKRVDDPLLNIVRSEPGTFAHAEERRLFYVAMTRARRQVYLIADAARPSVFVQELRRKHRDVRRIGWFMDEDAPPCPRPRCGGGLVVSRSRRTRRCTNHPLCEYRARRCDECSEGYLIVAGRQAKCSNDACGASARVCPRCKVGILRMIEGKEGKYSSFWGCSEYRAEPPCTYTRPMESHHAAN